MKKSYKWPACIVLLIWLVAGCVALFAPDDILSANKMLRDFSNIMSTGLSTGGGQKSKSGFPEVTELYHSIAWLSLPFSMILIWYWLSNSVGSAKSGLLTKVPLSFGNRICLILVLPIWLLLAYAGLSMNHGGGTRLVALGSSRWQLAAFGFGFSIGVATALAFFFFSLKRIFSKNIKG